jgi:hypothetical protein
MRVAAWRPSGSAYRPHFERVLVVCGMPNAGKSRALRSMYRDLRFGTNGLRLQHSRPSLVPFSRERVLSIIFSSPHEKEESLNRYLRKIDRYGQRAGRWFWRFNLACALQPAATPKTPDLVTICQAILATFSPERIRVAQLDPYHDGRAGMLLSHAEVDRLWSSDIELLTIDARRFKTGDPNGLLLADFFDFT